MIVYRSTSRKIFEYANYLFYILFSISIVAPFVNVIAISLSNSVAVDHGEVGMLPVGLNFNAYKKIILNIPFIYAFFNTVFLTVINTFLVIMISLSAAYCLANKHTKGKKILMRYMLIPMYFSGGLIPLYLLVSNWLNLNDTYAALILPSITSIFYVIIFKNSIEQLPKELPESAELDGASDYMILINIIIPVIIPMITAFTIFSAVGYWNEWFNVLLFITDPKKYTLQFKLRELIAFQVFEDSPDSPFRRIRDLVVNVRNLKMAALMVTILPIVVVYPFLQKYFIHGIIVGAVKG